MPALLDSFPYPFDNPTGQELHQVLSQIHPTGQAALFVARKTGLDTSLILAEQPVFYLWGNILDHACTQGKLRPLVQEVFDRLSSTSPFRGLVQEILQDHSVPVAEPRDAEGAPRFIEKTDEVFEQEALLYHDDLTLQIGKVPALVAALNKLIALSSSICKLNVDFNGQTKSGTGFRIGGSTLLTNWHVLHLTDSGTVASAVAAEFLYEDNGQGGITPSKVINCDPATVHTSKDDDWAVIQTKDPLDATWPIIPMDASVNCKVGDPAYIIQHPSGARKRLGFVRNQVSFVDERVTHYLTDTQEGSSGAPVFDGEGKLFALHHAGGRPQEIVGKAPLRKNEGIRISRILAGLKEKNVQIK
jgi:V8-like Glu-specific endopeptidase